MAREPGDFSPNKVSRASITNFRTADKMEFSLNPSSVKETKGDPWAIDGIPGTSDPKLAFGSGKVSTIKFSLNVDAEVTLRRRGVPFGNGASVSRPMSQKSYSVAGEIAFLESFTFPADTAEGGNGAPDTLIFRMGSRYPGIVCLMATCDIDITQFTPQLEPARAKLDITLYRYVFENRVSSVIWRPDGNNGTPNGDINI